MKSRGARGSRSSRRTTICPRHSRACVDDHGIGRISAVGGRTTATSLVDAGLVQDLYLTTSPIEGGEPDTPWYVGTRPAQLDPIVKKREDAAAPILFDHLAITTA